MAQKTELPDIAKLNHFTEENLYTGSKTKDWEKGTVIRYKVWPDRENEKLIASCWAQDVCYEKAQDKEEREFPPDGRGCGRRQELADGALSAAVGRAFWRDAPALERKDGKGQKDTPGAGKK